MSRVIPSLHYIYSFTIFKLIIIIIPRLYNPLKARAYQPTAGLIFTYPQTEMEDHLASFVVTNGQHFESLDF